MKNLKINEIAETAMKEDRTINIITLEYNGEGEERVLRSYPCKIRKVYKINDNCFLDVQNIFDGILEEKTTHILIYDDILTMDGVRVWD